MQGQIVVMGGAVGQVVGDADSIGGGLYGHPTTDQGDKPFDRVTVRAAVWASVSSGGGVMVGIMAVVVVVVVGLGRSHGRHRLSQIRRGCFHDH